MKELSIEEKAHRYDEALKVLHKYDGANIMFSQSLKEEMFPELKESEDERIRQLLLRFVKYDMSDNYSDDFTPADCVAWLEKQGKNNMGISEATKKKLEDNLKKALEKETAESFNEFLDEQKPADLNIKAGNWYVCDMEVINDNMVTAFHPGEIFYCPKDGYLDDRGVLFEVGCLDVFRLATEKEIPQPKQNPAWSEEDERILNTVIHNLRYPGVNYYKKPIEEEVKWIKSLKDKVQPQPKQEWSEEDEQLYNDLSDTYFYNDEDYPEETYKLMLKRVLDWMTKRAKSLRPNYWKPSEEQLNALHWCVMNVGSTEHQVLQELLEQLEKLKD